MSPGTVELLPWATVVVPTVFERPETLLRCVQSLLAQDHPAFDVLVVDNREAAAGIEPPAWARFGGGVRVLREPRPGISAARNRGLAEATGDVVAFTDDDVQCDRGWLSALAGRFVRSPEVDCVTGLVVPLELETAAQRWMEEFGGFGKGDQWRIFDLAGGPTDHLHPYAGGRFGTGANMAFRVDALRGLGGFDEALGTGTPARGGEDLAAFVNVLWAGGQIAYEPSAMVHHAHRRTLRELVRQLYGYGVGLSAMLTSLVMRDRRHLSGIVRRIPAGARWLLSPSSGRNARRRADFPMALVGAELLGVLLGPIAYMRSRWRMRRWTA